MAVFLRVGARTAGGSRLSGQVFPATSVVAGAGSHSFVPTAAAALKKAPDDRSHPVLPRRGKKPE